MPLFAGCDWGCEEHAVSVVDETGAVVFRDARHTMPRDSHGWFGSWRRWDRPPSCRSPSKLRRACFVDTLIDAGHPIVPLHQSIAKACRPRYRAAGGKDDLGDSYT